MNNKLSVCWGMWDWGEREGITNFLRDTWEASEVLAVCPLYVFYNYC